MQYVSNTDHYKEVQPIHMYYTAQIDNLLWKGAWLRRDAIAS